MTSRATLALALILALPPTPSSAAYGPTAHLRPQSPRVAKWLAAAERQSPTVRGLVDRIERSDLIVYLEIRHDLAQGVAACLTWMASTDSARFVRASLRPDLRQADAVSMIAHELQHVVEVIEHPDVRSNESLLDLYVRIGHPTAQSGKQWDTEAAIEAGTVARLEATGVRRPAPRGIAG
jgi:hypothetical protein